MKARRLFAGVAVAATEPLRAWLAGLQQDLRGEKIRWVRLENLHLTVEFFGAVAEERIPGLVQALATAAAGAPAFQLRLDGLGTFGSLRQPRVLWLGVESAGLQALHVRAAAALRAAGWMPEARPFAPHLTLGRINRLKDLQRFSQAVESRHGWTAEEQAVRELILYESVFGRYVPMWRWPLSAG